MKIIFMGTPEFAVGSLSVIHNSHHEVVVVITAADKPAGRGKKMNQSAVKKYALEQDIPLLQPKNLKSPEFIEELRAYKADLFVVVAFRMLPEIVWAMPKKGTINLHGSLLPDYRGAAPINWAVINGDDQTGVTTFFINAKIDTGEILLQETVSIKKDDTAGDVHDKLMVVGSKTLLETINQISTGNVNSKKQQWNSDFRKAPKIYKDDCRIDWNKKSDEIVNLIKGLSPYPTAFTNLIDGSGSSKKVKIFFAEVGDLEDLKPGEVKFEGRKTMLIGTKDYNVIITDLQLEGKKRMKIKDFLAGFRSENTWNAL